MEKIRKASSRRFDPRLRQIFAYYGIQIFDEIYKRVGISIVHFLTLCRRTIIPLRAVECGVAFLFICYLTFKRMPCKEINREFKKKVTYLTKSIYG